MLKVLFSSHLWTNARPGLRTTNYDEVGSGFALLVTLFTKVSTVCDKKFTFFRYNKTDTKVWFKLDLDIYTQTCLV